MQTQNKSFKATEDNCSDVALKNSILKAGKKEEVRKMGVSALKTHPGMCVCHFLSLVIGQT